MFRGTIFFLISGFILAMIAPIFETLTWILQFASKASYLLAGITFILGVADAVFGNH